MNPMPELIPMLKQLRLSGMAEALPLRLEQARSAPLDYAEFLELIVGDELTRRAADGPAGNHPDDIRGCAQQGQRVAGGRTVDDHQIVRTFAAAKEGRLDPTKDLLQQ